MPLGTPAADPAPGPVLRPRTGLAWTVILAAAAAVAALHADRASPGDGSRAFALLVIEKQVRMQYGMREWAASLGAGALPSAAKDLETLRQAIGQGPAAVRQRFAVVAGDMAGPAAARAELDRLEGLLREKARTLEGDEAAVQEALRALYAGDGAAHTAEAAAALPEDRRELLRARLGWFGRLALAPEGSPDRPAVLEGNGRLALSMLGVGLGLLVLLGIGLVAALVHWLRVLSRGASFRFAAGPTPPGIYAETFAVWILSFLLVSLGAAWIAESSGSRHLALVLSLTLPWLTLAALGWPVLRGIPFARVREDLGLRLSPTPLRDALAGIGCWVLGLPVMAIVAFATLVAATVLHGKSDPLDLPGSPGHPIADEIAGGIPWVLLLLMASVMAPIVEETFFRGVLYRHLRDATRGAGRTRSIALSAVVSGLVFGAIHPQGLLLAPVIGAVAWPLVHARELRDSLVAPMAAHAVHNAVLVGLAWLFLGS